MAKHLSGKGLAPTPGRYPLIPRRRSDRSISAHAAETRPDPTITPSPRSGRPGTTWPRLPSRYHGRDSGAVSTGRFGPNLAKKLGVYNHARRQIAGLSLDVLMKGWLTILAFTCSQAATSITRLSVPNAPADRPVSCCCCEAGACRCGCVSPPVGDPDSEKPQRPGFCSCDDQPIPMPESPRVAAERLSELAVGASSPDAHGVDQDDGAAGVSPRAHGPPPNIALVRTFVLLT